MHVLFYVADQNPHRDRSLGITGYTDGLIEELKRRDGIELSAIASRSSYRPALGERVRVLPFPTDFTPLRLLADHAVGLLSSTAHLWHFPKGFLPGIPTRAPTIGTVHDTIPIHYLQHYPASRSRLGLGYFRRALLHALAHLDGVITVSETSRLAIERFAKQAGVRPPPIYVTWQGARFEAQAGSSRAKQDYVIHLGSSAPHKRTLTLLEHWDVLSRRGRELPRLMVIGKLDPALEALADRVHGVERRTPVNDADLEQLLAAARALILPSEIEGFGLPALEAYYLGTPAVFVVGTAVQEVLGADAPGGFQLSDCDSLGAAIDDVLGCESHAIRETARSLRQRFSWRNCGERTLAAYQEVLAGSH